MERELRERLRGVRLIFEAIDPDLLNRVYRIVGLLGRTMRDAAACLAADYPSVLAAYLVGEGIYRYKAGAYWPNLVVKGLDQEQLGSGFLRAIRTLGLETFDLLAEEGALKYVAPILAHGGIPRYCLKDFFFNLLVPELRRSGSADAAELLAIWRTRKTAFQGIDRPVKRFLLYGGDAAVDLLDRCVELVSETARAGLVPSPDEVGLPLYLVKEFSSGPVHTAKLGQARSLPRPRVRLDPWDPLGPVLELPPLPRDIGDGVWRVSDGISVRNLSAPTTESRTVHLGPARAWDIELLSGGQLLRNVAFECLDDNPTIVFDPRSGLLVPDTVPIALESAWLLCPADTLLTALTVGGQEGKVRVREELPDPVGPWQGFRLAHYDLRGLRAIRAERSGLAAIPRIQPPGQRPELLSEPLTDVMTDEGYPVFDRLPILHIPSVADVSNESWRLHVRSGGFERLATAAELGGLRIDLLAVLGASHAGVVHLTVRGPLGSDLRASFAVVPGLAIERPSELLLPGARREAAVVVRARSVIELEDQRPGEEVRLVVPEGADEARCETRHEERALALRIYVPRLLWGVARTTETGIILGANRLGIGIEELEGGTATALVVSTRRPHVPVALALERRGQQLQQSEWKRTSARQGRAVFDLAPFRDTARLSGESSLDFM
ncbi:MAG: hypothetical protein ACRERE_40760 [Candidatus Entotheonellia bacterium]